MRIVQISDTHLLAEGPVMAGNFERAVEFINASLRPDLVVHSGDVVGIDPDDARDREAAALALRSLDAPYLVVPGNHDVGEPGPEPWMGVSITSARVAEHNRAFGEVPFLEPLGEWGILGLNSELFGSGLPEEEEQWRFLERVLGEADGPPLLLFGHQPLWKPHPAAAGETHVPDATRLRLLGLPGAARLRAAGSGHLHCHRRRRRPELLEVWSPATACIGDAHEGFSEWIQPGIVEWTLDGDQVSARFYAPPGLDERDALDIPELIARIEVLQR